MNRAAVNQANRNNADVQNLIRAVDRSAQEMFLLPIGIVPDVREQVRRGFNLCAFRLDAATGEFNRCQDQRCLCFAQARLTSTARVD